MSVTAGLPLVGPAWESRVGASGAGGGEATCGGLSLEEDKFSWSCPSWKRQQDAGRQEGQGRGC